MGPNSFRNLTYAAVLAVVGILGYLIFQSSQKKKAARAAELAQSADLTTGLGGLTDTLGSLTTSTSAALASGAAAAGAAASNAVSGSLISPAASGTGSSDVKNVTVEDAAPSAASDAKSGMPSTSTKAASDGGKKPQSPATKKPTAKFDAGSGGEFMAMAGAFASKDNADAVVAKLKKLGFTKSEVVKLENSANVNVVAGYYAFKGGADAAVRTLKANKIDGFIRKKSGEIFKSTPAAAAPVKPAVKPAAKSAAPKPS
jgi:SPOR domain